jgi:hypothetical protein
MFSTENWLRLYIKFSKFYPMYLISCVGRASARLPNMFKRFSQTFIKPLSKEKQQAIKEYNCENS